MRIFVASLIKDINNAYILEGCINELGVIQRHGHAFFQRRPFDEAYWDRQRRKESLQEKAMHNGFNGSRLLNAGVHFP